MLGEFCGKVWRMVECWLNFVEKFEEWLNDG